MNRASRESPFDPWRIVRPSETPCGSFCVRSLLAGETLGRTSRRVGSPVWVRSMGRPGFGKQPSCKASTMRQRTIAAAVQPSTSLGPLTATFSRALLKRARTASGASSRDDGTPPTRDAWRFGCSGLPGRSSFPTGGSCAGDTRTLMQAIRINSGRLRGVMVGGKFYNSFASSCGGWRGRRKTGLCGGPYADGRNGRAVGLPLFRPARDAGNPGAPGSSPSWNFAAAPT